MNPLPSKGTRQLEVAVLGGGLTGAATAACLATLARARGRPSSIHLYDPPFPSRCGAPALLSAECRSRLAALGARIAADWRVSPLRAFEVVSQGRRVVMPVGKADLWVVDDWGERGAGKTLVARALAGAAALQGVKILHRTVTHLKMLSPDLPEDFPSSGRLVVRSNGFSQCVDAAVLAGGTQAALGERFFKGFEGAPSLPGVRARLRLAHIRWGESGVARLLWAPCEGVHALLLIPAHKSIWALAWGPRVAAPEFCEAVMAAARDRVLTEGFELCDLELTRVPCGASPNSTAAHRLAIGASAYGHPFDLCVSSRLLAASRAALAIVDSRGEEPELSERCTLHGMDDMVRECEATAKTHRWFERSPERVTEAFRRAIKESQGREEFPCTTLLGRAALSPRRLLRAARIEGIKALFSPLLGWSQQPTPPSAEPTDENLFYVVDDDEDTRAAVTTLIESQGGRVVAFADELGLYGAAARHPPKAIVLDVVLSWVDGLVLCHGLKTHPLTQRTRVVVMSGLDLPHLRERAAWAGAAAFLPKPVDPRTLWAALSGHSIRLRPSESGAVDGPPSGGEIWNAS